jgi:hypothetical protein
MKRPPGELRGGAGLQVRWHRRLQSDWLHELLYQWRRLLLWVSDTTTCGLCCVVFLLTLFLTKKVLLHLVAVHGHSRVRSRTEQQSRFGVATRGDTRLLGQTTRSQLDCPAGAPRAVLVRRRLRVWRQVHRLV